MADTIRITKLTNANVLVQNDTVEYALNPDVQVRKNIEKDACLIFDKSGSLIDTFKTVDVLEVVRKDATVVPISDLDTLFTELITFFFFKLSVEDLTISDLLKGTEQIYNYTANNYTDLTTVVAPVANEGELAYVRNSEGTKYIGGIFGATFFDKGTYLYTAGAWSSDRDKINEALQELDTDLTAAEAAILANDAEIAVLQTTLANRQSVYEVYESTSTPILITPTLIPMNIERFPNPNFSLIAGQCVCNFAGRLKITYSVSLDNNNNTRGIGMSDLYVDNIIYPGSRSFAYNRNVVAGEGTANKTVYADVINGTIVDVRSQSINGGLNKFSVVNASNLTFERIT